MQSLRKWLDGMGFSTEGPVREIVTSTVKDVVGEAFGSSGNAGVPLHVPFPSSLSELLKAGRDPKMEEWEYLGKDETTDGGWASQLQGMTHDAHSWYFLQEGKIMKMSDPPFEELHCIHIKKVKDSTGASKYFHFGSGEYTRPAGNPCIWVPVEYEGKNESPFLALIDLSLEPDGEYRFVKVCSGFLDVPDHLGMMQQRESGPWCSVNPLDGFLYTSDFDNVDRLLVYDPTRRVFPRGHPVLNSPIALSTLQNFGMTWEVVPPNMFPDNLDWSLSTGMGWVKFVGYFHLWQVKNDGVAPYELSAVQAGRFSPSGQLFLTSDSEKGIHGFCGLTGRFRGYIEKNGREVEGIDVWDRTDIGSGGVHVGYVENNLSSNDDGDIKHWSVPEQVTGGVLLA